MKRGSRFLITSRDYIWRAAERDLKIQSLPALKKSHVVINVGDLTENERAQILYNHVRMGGQPAPYKAALKPFLPDAARRPRFLPESARRLGDPTFTTRLPAVRESVLAFFDQPQDFLLDTIRSLAADCQAAIAVLFLNGGRVRSPVTSDTILPAAEAFGVEIASARTQLENLNGSLLLYAQDEHGPYWGYRHPTVSDAFASFVANSPELVGLYLQGAKAASIADEVTCVGAIVRGASVIVPDILHPLLADRIETLPRVSLASFLVYRGNAAFNGLMLSRQPKMINDLVYYTPLKDDLDATLVAGKLLALPPCTPVRPCAAHESLVLVHDGALTHRLAIDFDE